MSPLDRASTLRDVSTDGGVLYYHEAGSGPPLLLLHGSGPGVTGWQNYRGVLADFAEHFRCLILEFPGFGVSEPAPGPPMATAGPAVLRFLAALDIDSVAVIGNSMGGIVAANLAIAKPERFSRLVTIGGLGVPLLAPGPAEGLNLLMAFVEQPTRDRLVDWLHAMVHDRSLITEELIEERWALATDRDALASARAMYSREAFRAREAAAAAATTPPYWAMLHRLRIPTLLTWGRDDRVSPLDTAILPMRTIPRAELHVFPDCGHWTMFEQRDAFVSTVLPFLRRKDAA